MTNSSFLDAVVVLPEVSNHDTANSASKLDILFPVLILSQLLNFVLEVGNIAIGENDIR